MWSRWPWFFTRSPGATAFISASTTFGCPTTSAGRSRPKRRVLNPSTSFFFTDHFEPGEHRNRTRRWKREYRALALRHRDSNYGEVELHLHHASESYESARQLYQGAIEYFQKFGFLKTVDGKTRFGFFHGINALDNSMIPGFCGVNRELTLLRELGCYVDWVIPRYVASARRPSS